MPFELNIMTVWIVASLAAVRWTGKGTRVIYPLNYALVSSLLLTFTATFISNLVFFLPFGSSLYTIVLYGLSAIIGILVFRKVHGNSPDPSGAFLFLLLLAAFKFSSIPFLLYDLEASVVFLASILIPSLVYWVTVQHLTRPDSFQSPAAITATAPPLRTVGINIFFILVALFTAALQSMGFFGCGLGGSSDYLICNVFFFWLSPLIVLEMIFAIVLLIDLSKPTISPKKKRWAFTLMTLIFTAYALIFLSEY